MATNYWQPHEKNKPFVKNEWQVFASGLQSLDRNNKIRLQTHSFSSEPFFPFCVPMCSHWRHPHDKINGPVFSIRYYILWWQTGQWEGLHGNVNEAMGMCSQSVHICCYTYKRNMPSSVYLWSDNCCILCSCQALGLTCITCSWS